MPHDPIRAFLIADFHEHAHPALFARARILAHRLGLAPIDHLHLTLQYFQGVTDITRLADALEKRLRRKTSFQVATRGVNQVFYQDLYHIWVIVEKSDALETIYEQTHRIAQDLGFDGHMYSFAEWVPHIKIGVTPIAPRVPLSREARSLSNFNLLVRHAQLSQISAPNTFDTIRNYTFRRDSSKKAR